MSEIVFCSRCHHFPASEGGLCWTCKKRVEYENEAFRRSLIGEGAEP